MLKYFIIISFSTYLVSCQTATQQKSATELADTSASVTTQKNDCNTYRKQAQTADSILVVAKSINTQEAEKALIAFNNFTSFCKTDSLTPVFLLKIGQVAQSLKKYSQAQIAFKNCVDNFPDFKNRGAALFLLANLYDDAAMLNNEANAKILYEQIIKEYPKTNWEKDAKACISNLGKTDEQLIKEFLKKNK